MSNVEKDNLFEEVVTENAANERTENPSAGCGDGEHGKGCCHKREAKIGVEPVNEPARSDFWDEVRKDTQREYRRIRVKEFFRALVEVGGYAALGGVMLAAMLNGIVAAYVAVPVFTVSWIWSAIRMDRFFRR